MMASLPQTTAQTGLASILAALGQAAPAGTATDAPGFEQLFASLPGGDVKAGAKPPAAALTAPRTDLSLLAAATTFPAAESPVMTTTPAPIAVPAEAMPKATTATPPAAALFGLPQPAADAPAQATPANAATASETVGKPAVAAKATPETAPVADAAAAASLLIAVATPFKSSAPASDKAAPIAASNDAPVDGEAASEVVATTGPIAQPAAIVAGVPAAATAIAAAMPANEKPVAEKTAKAAAFVTRQPEATAAPVSPAIKIAEAAKPLAAFTAIEPKVAKPAIDAGAAMTVLFAQPDLQGAAPLLEAAKAAPLAERTLDLTSDDQWIAQLAADIAATKSDKGDISFRLMPRHLGRLDVSMLGGDEGVTLKLDTQHEATATIVQAAQPRLVEDLRQQGVRVADAQVTHTPAEAGRQQQNQSQGRGSAPDTSHLIETAADQADPTHDERTADRRGRFA